MPILASLVPKPTPMDPPTTPIRIIALLHLTGAVHACLNDFFNVKGIDLRHQESLMVDVEFTSENIPSILPLRISEILHIKEGVAWMLQAFVLDWNEQLEAKRQIEL
ncbi:hypothetical protein BDQ17DRAFT_1430887 [Cyathus striatus]|nr:hypothetical protein BDQ17DRAFT_1430887 [Cyathus striatus]